MELFKDFLMANRVRKLLSKNHIEIVHFIPGRLRLRSPDWKHRQAKIQRFLEELKTEKGIISLDYTPETGSLLILFDDKILHTDMDTIEKWLIRAEELMDGC